MLRLKGVSFRGYQLYTYRKLHVTAWDKVVISWYYIFYDVFSICSYSKMLHIVISAVILFHVYFSHITLWYYGIYYSALGNSMLSTGPIGLENRQKNEKTWFFCNQLLKTCYIYFVLTTVDRNNEVSKQCFGIYSATFQTLNIHKSSIDMFIPAFWVLSQSIILLYTLDACLLLIVVLLI